MGVINLNEETNVGDILNDGVKNKALKFTDDRTPFIIAVPQIATGWVRFVQTPSGFKMPVNSMDQENGWSPANDKIDKWMADGYAKCKNMYTEGATDDQVKAAKKKYNDVRASKNAQIVIVKGKYVNIEDPETGDVKRKISFDDPEIGIVNLSKKQKEAIFNLVEDSNTPHINSTKDLVGRVLIIKKEVDNDSTKMYKPVTWVCTASNSKTDIHKNLGTDFSEFDLSESFKPDIEKIEEAYKMLTGEYVDNTQLPTLEEKEDTNEKINDLSDVDDDFDDDIPY